LRYTYPKDSKPETYKPKYKYYAFLPYEYQNKYVNTYKDPTDAAQLCYAHKLPFTPDLQRKNKNIGYAHINETSVNNLIDKFIPMEFTIDDIDDLKGRINQIYTSYTELFNKKNTEGLYLLIVALDDEYYKYKVEGKSPTKSNWTVVSREKLTNPDNKTKTDGDSLNTTKDLSAPASPVTLDAPTTNPYLYKAHTETAAPDTPTPVKTVTPIPAETITPTTDPKASAETVTPTADPAMLTEIDNLEAKNADLESHISTKNLEYSNLFISNENFARKYNELMDAHNNLIEEHKTMKTANEVLKSTKNNYKRIGGAILLATAAFYCFRICRWGQKSKNSDINVNNNPNIPVNNTPGTPVSNNSDISVNIDKDAESIKKLKRIVINTLENKEKPQEKLL
jgi:hypothetical protein